MTTRTSKDGPREVSETLAPTGSSGSSGRDPNQTRQPRQASNASAIMISDVFMAVFMPPKITADRGGGQAQFARRTAVLMTKRRNVIVHIRNQRWATARVLTVTSNG
jgi:hypothetical protein